MTEKGEQRYKDKRLSGKLHTGRDLADLQRSCETSHGTNNVSSKYTLER